MKRDYDREPVVHAPLYWSSHMSDAHTVCGIVAYFRVALKPEDVTCKNCLRSMKK